MSESNADPIKVVAVVSANDREWLVLNRQLSFVYERSGNDYIGSDGPFRDHLYYRRGGGKFVAFAGRELSLTMSDGSIQKLKDHWWSGEPAGFVSIAYGDVESLKRCYVFMGASINRDDLAVLRSTYEGCVYPYWDYEKIIKYDDMRNDLYRRLFHEEGRRRALTLAIKAKHRQLLAKAGA
ncbi:hypothetical protein C3Y08_01745 [Burkholderia gladioli]|uniref:hypothetical protein n=1 Tax=Burkholderia gladioli TaxID=28095 RepID=UPI000D4582F3|nr:hypothetical protein [Burkholderia gladioli]POS10195.1 hypothetical protein C3Y08_01745 [Burkholderia gladioli]